jgi:glycosyltransferase involved in cell wall biosynthesis
MLSTERNGAKLNKNTEAKISVIIVTYNAAETLQNCLDSIYSQKYQAIEIIVIDGKSTDDTVKILEENTGHIYYWKSESDRGIYDAMNKAIKHITGDWVYFLGADDRLLSGFSELAVKLMPGNTVYYGYSKEFYHPHNKPSFQILTGEFSKYRLAKYCLNHQAIIYPASAFINNNYDLKYKVLADYAFNIRLWGDNSFKKIYYPIPIVSYNMNGFSSATEDLPFKKDKALIIRQSMGWIMYVRFLLKKYRKKLLGETDF